MQHTLTWVVSHGGPLLCVPESLLNAWEGAEPPADGRVLQAESRLDPEGPATDFDRACDLQVPVGPLPVGAGTALVLGDEPAPTTWWPDGAGGYLVRELFSADDDAVAAAMAAVPDDLRWNDAPAWTIAEPGVVLLDAMEPGNDPSGERLRFELPVGPCRVAWAVYSHDELTSLVLVRLRPGG